MTQAQMMIVLIFTLSMVSAWFFALLIWSDRRHARHMQDREAERQDRQMIMQRVQAPETAVIQHVQQQEPVAQPKQHIEWDNDQDYWRARDQQDEMLTSALGLNPLGDEQ